MLKFLVYLSMVPVAVIFLFGMAAVYGPRRHERGELNAKDKKVLPFFAAYLIGAFAWTQYDAGTEERRAKAEAAAKQEFRELVQTKCAAANKKYEDALMARENYGALSGTQQARMGREWGADGDWVQDQVSRARRALGDCEQGLKAEKTAIYQSHGLSLEN